MRGATGWGRITTFVGTVGQQGHTGDGGPAAKAALYSPFTCAFDRKGRLLIAEGGSNCVRRITPNGQISTVYGPTSAEIEDVVAIAVPSGGPDDAFVISERKSRRVRFLPNGATCTDARLQEPHDVVEGGPGMVLVADVKANLIWSVRSDGKLSAAYGTGRRVSDGDGDLAEKASFAGARAVARAKDGTVYVCEREGNRIRRISGEGRIAAFAGTGKKGYTGDGGPATMATFNGPKGLMVDPKTGDLYIADTENHAVRCIEAKTGTLTTVAGGRRGTGGDGGPADRAGLDRPHGICFGPDGALYIADTGNHRVCRVERVAG